MSPTTAAWPTRKPVRTAAAAVFGVVVGFGLSRIGFTDDAEFHRMLRFVELRLFLTFCTAVAVATIGFLLLRSVVRLAERPLHKGSIAGGVLFGVGWAVCGACPSVAFTQLGEGRWWALATMAGLVLGARMYPRVHERYFRFSRGDCNS
jgi:uncharacterized membrane protein YedE/YeeE